MKPRRITPVLLAFVVSATVSARAGATISVVATVFPIAAIVGQIGGQFVAVHTLLPAGANPHTFEPTPEQLRVMASAALIVRVGAGLDDWLARLLATSDGAAPTIAITDGLELLGPADSPHGDPHVWLDPVLVRDRIVPKLVLALTNAEPQRQADFEGAATQFAAELTQLDRDIAGALQPLSHRGFVAVHPAWRYFARRYGLEEVAVIESSPGKEPSAQAIAAIIERGRARQVRVVLTEPQMTERTAVVIARELGAVVVNVDPLGGPHVPQRDSYLALMRYNLRVFEQALR
ncbi:MAG TPA: metal ABC transporter substrate-binding protein [Candidatus Kryptonia bacterium]|nr:metal ABC transporter substrate-binding protein [Candidatus Kryptonia bacterium]